MTENHAESGNRIRTKLRMIRALGREAQLRADGKKNAPLARSQATLHSGEMQMGWGRRGKHYTASTLPQLEGGVPTRTTSWCANSPTSGASGRGAPWPSSGTGATR